MGMGPMKPGDAESLEARKSTKVWSASIVIGMLAIFGDAVLDDDMDDDGVVEDEKVRWEQHWYAKVAKTEKPTSGKPANTTKYRSAVRQKDDRPLQKGPPESKSTNTIHPSFPILESLSSHIHKLLKSALDHLKPPRSSLPDPPRDQNRQHYSTHLAA
ncbi:MAG: hypothetical protein ASARMPREDX12_001614 [Alectoria sarmentosa]|nr:MAG: hypothetical protein ASARMPREDX12_001614 [Alectoria sarmentosa]